MFGRFLLLIFGLIIAGVGVAAWIYSDPGTAFLLGDDIQTARLISSVGMGMVVIGGGIALGGLISIIKKK
jgi:hypothetical protein